MLRSFLIVASLSLSLTSLNETFAELQGILVEGEDFDGIEQFSIWQTCNGRWYAKEHLAAYAMGGAYAVANEFSIGAVMETKLERPLPAGEYNVWVRVVIWTDSDDAVEISLNGARRIYAWTIKTSGRGYRWLKGEITTTREGNVLQAKAVKASQQNFGESPRPPCRFFVLDSIYISPAGEEAHVSSTRKNDELVIDGRLLTCYGLGAAVTNQVSDTESKNTEPTKGNLIGNGSFEIGFNQGWTARSKFGILNEQHLDRTTSKHGNFSLCTRNAKDETILNPIHSGAIQIAAQGLYTLSAWVKTQTPGRISLGLVPVKGRRAVLSKAATSQTEWQRISVSGPVKRGEYYVSVSGGHFWLDGVQLEPGGKASEFQQRVPVSAGVLSDLPGNVYFEGENERPKLLVYADESLKKSKVTVRCRVYDI
jgi:hypothetical protein